LGTNKIENPFSMESQKTLVIKVVGHEKMHISAKDEVNI
jgi:hypothetical protein